MFSINSSIFLFLPIFLFFIVGQMMPSISGIPIPMMNNINTGNGNDTDTDTTNNPMDMPANSSNESTLDDPTPLNFTSRLDDQNRALMDKFLDFGKKLTPAELGGTNGSFHLSNEILAEFNELYLEIFNAVDEDKDENLTRQELCNYAKEIMIPYVVEMAIKYKTPIQLVQYLAKLNDAFQSGMLSIKASINSFFGGIGSK